MEGYVVTEQPKGSGLGSAAMNAARTFRFDSRLANPVIKTMQIGFALRDQALRTSFRARRVMLFCASPAAAGLE